MDLLKKSLLCAAIAGLSAQASAISISYNVEYGDPAAAEAAFLASSFNQVTENFEGFNPLVGDSDPDGNTVEAFISGNQQASWVRSASSFQTAVGSFSLTSPQNPPDGDDVANESLMIENKNTGEFGRETTGNWLDSNDAYAVQWEIMKDLPGDYNALGFYLSDANDINASLVLKFADGTFSDAISINSPLQNNNLAYISIFSDVFFQDAILTFDNGSGTNDGWGIDDVTVAQVPEPGTLALLGLGLAAVGIRRTRKNKS